MAKKKNDGKSGLNGIKVSDETRCQMKIIEGQGMASSDAVVEKAIQLLYSIMPEDKNDRKPLDVVVSEATQIIESNRTVDS